MVARLISVVRITNAMNIPRQARVATTKKATNKTSKTVFLSIFLYVMRWVATNAVRRAVSKLIKERHKNANSSIIMCPFGLVCI